MSDRGQHTHPSTDSTPAAAEGRPDTDAFPGSPLTPSASQPASDAPQPEHTPLEPNAPQPASDAPQPEHTPLEPNASQPEHVPLELSAGDGDDTPFRLTAPADDDPNATGTAPPHRKTRTIVLASLLTVSLASLVAVGWFGWRVNSQRHTTLSTPTKVGALTLDDSEEATATADYLQTALTAEISLDKAVGAVYSGTDEKSVLFFGGTTLLWSPKSDLDSAFKLISDDQSAVTGLHEVDAGAFGGTMKCGVATAPEGDMPVCGWADHGSLALAMFPNRTESEAEPLMRELRSAIQTRS